MVLAISMSQTVIANNEEDNIYRQRFYSIRAYIGGMGFGEDGGKSLLNLISLGGISLITVFRILPSWLNLGFLT